MRTLLILSILVVVPVAHAIDLATYRKIDSPGMDAAKVLLIAGHPDARQRVNNCEKWMYKGTDTALAGQIVTVEVCDGKVVRASTI